MNSPAPLVLLPQPQHVRYDAGRCTAAAAIDRVETHIDPAAVTHPQGYTLTITPQGVRIVGHDDAGVFYGRQTLQQIAQQSAGAMSMSGPSPLGEVRRGAASQVSDTPASPKGNGKNKAPTPAHHSSTAGLPCLHIEDWPDLPARGVMLDISRDKVPTMATLRRLVDMFASWKINQLQLYTEHTFAYPGHQIVWQNASPLTADEVRALDAYCRTRFIDLVPNQNSFGHMHRWLKHASYRHLAETPDGADLAFLPNGEPFSLCPVEPATLDFLAGLYDALLPNFTSKLFNVGCDETFDLGKGRSAAACQRDGKGRVYLDFLQRIHQLVTARGRRMMFWADIAQEHPELIPDVPRDAIALEWGYEANHPFAQRCRRLADAGLTFYVCPGTSSWCSYAGRTQNMLGNLRAAAQVPGAAGLLNTDWGDSGHLQPLPVSYLGFAWGAALSWARVANDKLDLRRAADLFVFHDAAGVLATLAYDLGDTYRQAAGPSIANQSFLFLLLASAHEPKDSRRFQGVSVEALRTIEAYLARTMAPLDSARPAGDDADTLRDEFRYAAALLNHACRLGIARWSHPGPHVADLPAAERRTLAADLEPILAAHRRVWLARNRDGGRRDSAAHLEKLLALYRGTTQS